MGVLNAKKRFGIPASASMLFNIGSIIGGVAFAFILAPGFIHDHSQAGRAMIGMSIGTLIGGVAQWLIQMPSLRRVGYRYERILDWHDPGLRYVMNLLGPSVIGVGAVQVNVFVDQGFASFFGNGAVTWLNCAFRLMQFPIGLFGVAIATAVLPTVSAHVARGDIDQFRTTLSRAIRLAMFLCVPAACGLAVLAHPIISVIYQHGKFDALATAQTVACLRAFAIGLAGYAAIKVIGPTFYAFGDSRTPMFIALGSVIVNAGLDYVFAITMDMKTAGLALSTSFVALTNFVLLMVFMRRKIQRLEFIALLRSFVKIVGASAAMSVAAWCTHERLVGHRYLDLVISITVAVVVFGAFCKLLRVEELGELLGALRFGSKQPAADGPQIKR
jgi:putative peptidoglycan lipid II flippase